MAKPLRDVVLAIVTLLALSVHRSAMAASFDCAKARSSREQSVCRDPKLSVLDTTLTQLYGDRRALLSAEGAALLRQSQLSWLRFVDLVCAQGKGAPHINSDGSDSCLQNQYNERLTELAQVARTVGPYRFNRIDLYDAQPAQESNTGSLPGFVTEHVAYPQIDGPLSPAASAWNKEKAQALPRDTDYCDTDLDFEVGYANDRFISLRWLDYEYCHGTPHGHGGYRAENEIMAPILRAIGPADVFGQTNQWVTPLQVMFWNALKAKGWSPPESESVLVKDQIDAEVIKPDRWLFTKGGLQTAFDSYEGGCYPCNPGTPTVAWETLKPILAKDAVVP
jgi:uncharacterized protein